MDNSKRKLLKSIGLISSGVILHNNLKAGYYIEDEGNLLYYNDQKSNITFDSSSQLIKANEVNYNKIIPKGLKKGGKIAITSPASTTNMWEISSTINTYKKLGCEVVIGNTIRQQKNQYRYFSAPDEHRANEFMEFILDKSIDAIICGRGGYGTGRILRMLNYEDIKHNPKIIIGFSDITLLLLAIYKMTGLVTYHGPVATINLNNFTLNHLQNAIFAKEKYEVINIPNIQIINDGIVEGEITGGNLTMITSSLGTPYEIDTTNKLLFIEDVAENTYQIDRMLTQLYNANKLQNASAFIFNSFKNINIRRPFYPNKGYTIKEVIEQIVKPLNKPLIYGFEFGHENNMITLPIGLKSKLDTKNKTFQFIENPVTI